MKYLIIGLFYCVSSFSQVKDSLFLAHKLELKPFKTAALFATNPINPFKTNLKYTYNNIETPVFVASNRYTNTTSYYSNSNNSHWDNKIEVLHL